MVYSAPPAVIFISVSLSENPAAPSARERSARYSPRVNCLKQTSFPSLSSTKKVTAASPSPSGKSSGAKPLPSGSISGIASVLSETRLPFSSPSVFSE